MKFIDIFISVGQSLQILDYNWEFISALTIEKVNINAIAFHHWINERKEL